MAAHRQQRPRRSFGYCDATLTDPRGKPLAYVDRLALHVAASGGGTAGFSGATFAPMVLEHTARTGLPHVRIISGGVPRLSIRGLQLTFHAGELPLPEGGWYCEAAIGSFRAVTRSMEARHRRTRRG